MSQLIIGARPSLLSRRQTELVAAALRAAWPGLEIHIREFSTRGDRELSRPLPEIGGKGLFTAELEVALHQGQIDLAVHSLKDLPITEGNLIGDLCIGAVLPREDARDVLISRHGLPLADLPPHPAIGTCSPRRAAQLLACRPDARILPLRGNVDTRLRKALTAEYDAIVLAAAGLIRLGLTDRVTEWLPLDLMLPAPGQGALAIQCRAADTATLALLRPIHDAATWAAVTAERAFLTALGGGCSAPVAADGEEGTGGRGTGDWGLGTRGGRPGQEMLHLRGLVAAADGRRIVRVSGDGPIETPELLGADLADTALAAGATAILAE